jgi:hypothetical protein
MNKVAEPDKDFAFTLLNQLAELLVEDIRQGFTEDGVFDCEQDDVVDGQDLDTQREDSLWSKLKA